MKKNTSRPANGQTKTNIIVHPATVALKKKESVSSNKSDDAVCYFLTEDIWAPERYKEESDAKMNRIGKNISLIQQQQMRKAS